MKATFRRVSTLRFLHPRLEPAAPFGLDEIPPGRLVTPAPTLIGCELLKNWPAPGTPQLWGAEISSKEARLYNISGSGQQHFLRGCGPPRRPALGPRTAHLNRCIVPSASCGDSRLLAA